MATVNHELSVKIKFDTPTLESELRAAEGLILKSTEVTEAKILSSDKLHQQKLAQQREMAFKRYETSREIAEKRALDKSLKAQTSWSAKMTKNLESLTMTVKGFFAAWAAAQISSIVRDSIQVAGGMRELADGIGVTTQEYFALSSAMMDAGAQAEKLDKIFTNLNEITSGGGDEKQRNVLLRLGISAPQIMSSVELFDRLIQGFNSAKINADDIADILDKRTVPSFRRLASSIDGVNEANAKYKFPISDEEQRKLDDLDDAWNKLWRDVKLFFADMVVRDDDADYLGKGFDDAFSKLVAYRNTVREINDLQVSWGDSSVMPPPGPQIPYGKAQTTWATLPEQIITAPARQIGPAYAAPMSYNAGAFGKTFVGATSELTAQDFLMRSMNKSMDELMATAGNLPVVYEPFTRALTTSEEKLRAVQSAMGAVQNSMSGVFSMQSMLFNNEIAHLQAIEDRERERWESRSQMLRDAGLESSALYKREAQAYEKAQKDRQKKQTKLQSKAWEMEKIARIGTITMDIASAIVKAWATTVPTWLAPATAALASASGAVQLGIVASQQNPYKGFAFGGLVQGRGYADDVPIRTTPGEFVSTRESTERNREALEFGNRGGKIGRTGGVSIIVQGDIIGDQRYVEEKLIPNLQKALNRGHRLRLPA